MTSWKKGLAWGGLTLGAATACGLIIVAIVVDLDTADRIASIIGAVCGLAAICISILTLVRARIPAGGVHEVSQEVEGSTIRKNNTMIGRVGGYLRYGRPQGGTAPASPPRTPNPSSPVSNSPDSTTKQRLSNSEIDGDNLHIGQVEGDADIEREP
ncbi:hypothetical protein [Streptomyces sp. NPDC086835]|uniref:hypothetical protein n=1 Tax=Streptomyces sp. NPDC086835 TaxID=3365761 RepID=UPI00381EF928